MGPRVAIVGTGRMGEAIARGLLRDESGAGPVVCTTRTQQRADDLIDRLRVDATTDNAAAINAADIVILALKPQVLGDELGRLAASFRPDQTVVSVAAGVTTGAIEQKLGGRIAVIRAMPNTAVMLERGVVALTAGARVTADRLTAIASLLRPLGTVLVVDEAQMDAVTAISGSGPAYVFAFAEAMIDAAEAEGIEAELAGTLVVATIAGAAAMLEHDPRPDVLRAQVTSPGGTTMAALAAFAERDLHGAVAAAVSAARRRGAELGEARPSAGGPGDGG